MNILLELQINFLKLREQFFPWKEKETCKNKMKDTKKNKKYKKKNVIKNGKREWKET
jgi:hypothetical protein